MRKRKAVITSVLAMSLAMTGSIGFGGSISKADNCGGLEEVDVYYPSEDDVIKDPILHWAVRVSLNSVKSKVTLTKEMVGDKAVHDISYELCNHPDDFASWEMPYYIENLEGLQYAKSAKMIDICYTSSTNGKRIADVSPLAELTQLEKLYLKQDGIDDISALGGLVNLENLDLSGNKEISDVSALANMTKLKTIDMSGNKIENINVLSNLEELGFVNLANNQIKALPDLSKLTKVYAFSVGKNQITDVTPIAAMKSLVELDLSSNPGIKDLKPLAKLYNLDKDKTFITDEAMKEDLFAAIEVNKLFNKFNISTMQASDLENVEAALKGYEALTDTQKEYIESDRVKACKDNKAKVEKGEEPKYYPEYDEGGQKTPVFDRIEIKVVDKKGNPMPGISFVKKSMWGSAKEVITDENGVLILKHDLQDVWSGEVSVKLKGEDYIVSPVEITYKVTEGTVTGTVNGKPATGLEELQFTLIPSGEYVDKSALKAALSAAGDVEEEYKYTEASWTAYREAYAAAEAAFDDIDAVKETVDTATVNLTAAYKALEKQEILTELKLTVRDANGNLFTRPFKFQIRVPETGAEAWNDLSDSYTGNVYLKTSPLWEDGKEWEILACYEEPYEFEPVKVTIGVDGNGKRYFKTINGENTDIDSAVEITVTPLVGGVPEGIVGRTPDNGVLSEYVKDASQYQALDYTPATFKALWNAVEDAKKVIEKQDAVQEDYNACAANIKQAEALLKYAADRGELGTAIENTEYAYGHSELYIQTTWEVLRDKWEAAQAVYTDMEVSQEQVDEALDALNDAKAGLQRRAEDKEKQDLENKLKAAQALKEEDYKSGYDKLQEVIIEAQKVYDNNDVTSEEVQAQIKALDDATAALVKKPQDVDYSCLDWKFRAKVIDKNGNPMAGVEFLLTEIGGETEKTLTSDTNGIIEESPYVSFGVKKEMIVRLADERYSTKDEHSYTVENINWVTYITAIDGQPYQDGVKLTYKVTERGETPEPQPVDKTALKEQIDLAKTYDGKEAEYTEATYQALQTALSEAEGVYNDEAATKEQVEEKTTALANAMAALEKRSQEVDYSCTDWQFCAKIIDKDGNPLSGVKFLHAAEGENEGDTLTSDDNGIIKTFLPYLEDGQEKMMVISLMDDRYSTEDIHKYTATYVASRWSALITAIDGQPYQDGIKLTYTVIEKGETPEPQPVDKTALKEQIDLAKTYDGRENDYTEASYQALQTALAEAEAVYGATDATEVQVTEKTAALADAIAALEEKTQLPVEVPDTCTPTVFRARIYDDNGQPIAGVKFELSVTEQRAGGEIVTSDDDGIITKELDFDAESNVIVTVQLADERYTTQDVHTFTVEGNTITSIDGQPFTEGQKLSYTVTEVKDTPEPIEKDALLNKINEMKAIEQGNYTPNSYRQLQNEITAAEVVYNNTDASQDDVNTAILALDTAKGNLTEKANKDKLKEAIDGAKALDGSKYTEDSYAKITVALSDAERVFNDENVSQDQVDEKTVNLNAALEAKTEKSNDAENPSPDNKPEDTTNKPSGGQNHTKTDKVNKAVQTGDSLHTMTFVLLMSVSAVLLLAGIILKRKYKR